ncbi:MAG TPA: hypothetical protein PKY77_23000 [Phycisphaerae bacterium]|nr:hypothetical protein [Phycisphaerae bacterium]HRY66432.1 hypothetical protein [Phycisphaerae bacterium]HSA25860.1 hypothetical protein [Phycisphaerae bacterium]
MTARGSVCLGLALVVLGASGAGGHAAGLDSPCPVEWQGLPFGDALRELAGRLDLPYVVDASVSAEAAQTRIRLLASHVDGRQALRWLARSAGLEAVVVDRTILVARGDRLPEAWKWRGGVPARGRDGQEAAWAGMRGRVAAVDWVDAPLSVVVRDLPRSFGVDLVVHPDILAKEVLIHLQQSAATLESVRDELARSLDAEVGYDDGVLWARPAHLPQGPAGSAPAFIPELINAKTDQPLRRPVVIDRPLADWQAFRGVVARATGLNCRVEVVAGAASAGLEARGSVGEVLEGARLLGLMSYQLQAGGEKGLPTLLIQVRAANR